MSRSGNQVILVARGPHQRAIQERGLRLEAPGEDVVLPIRVTDTPAQIGPMDLVLACVKAFDVEAAGEAAKAMTSPDTVVLTVQNDVDSPERLARILGRERILAGAAYLQCMLVAPGHIRQTSPSARLVFGELDGSRTARAEALGQALVSAGVEAELTPDIVRVLWTKLTFICAHAAADSGPK